MSRSYIFCICIHTYLNIYIPTFYEQFENDFEEYLNNSVVEFEIVYFVKTDNRNNLIYGNQINETAIH